MVEPIVISPVAPLIVAPLSILKVPLLAGSASGETFPPLIQALSTKLNVASSTASMVILSVNIAGQAPLDVKVIV